MNGPYETEREARASVQHILASPPGTGAWGDGNRQLLEDACRAAGVQLGAYDYRILLWLAGWEPVTCAVIAGLIGRAAAGAAAPDAGKLAAIRAVLGDYDRDAVGGREALERLEQLAGEDASPEEAVKAAVTGLHEPHQDTLRQVFADGIAYRTALFAGSASCPECVGYPQPCAEHQDHRDTASLYERLAADFGIDPDAEPGDDL